MSIKTKNIIIMELIIIISIVIASTFFYSMLKSQYINTLQQKLSAIVSSSVHFIDGDEHSNILATGVKTPEYNATIEVLRTIALDNDLIYLFTLDYSNEAFSFVYDTDEDVVNPIGIEYDTPSNGMFKTINDNEIFVEDELFEDEYGIFLSAYAPIVNSSKDRKSVV